MKLIILSLVFSLAVTGAAQKKKSFLIEAVKSESDDQSSLVSILYKKGVPNTDVEIEEHGTFIQIKIPRTVVPSPGTFYDGNSPYFRKVAAFQVDDTTVGIRLFVTQETKSLMSSLSTEYLKDRLLIHLDHKTVKPVHIDDSPPVEEIIARTTVRNDIKDPAEIMKGNVESSVKSNGLSKELSNKLAYVTVVSAIFMFLVICIVMIKRYKRGPVSVNGDDAVSHMRTLASRNSHQNKA